MTINQHDFIVFHNSSSQYIYKSASTQFTRIWIRRYINKKIVINQLIGQLKTDIIYYDKLIHSDLANCIEETANSQVLNLNFIERAHQEGKKGVGI